MSRLFVIFGLWFSFVFSAHSLSVEIPITTTNLDQDKYLFSIATRVATGGVAFHVAVTAKKEDIHADSEADLSIITHTKTDGVSTHSIAGVKLETNITIKKDKRVWEADFTVSDEVLQKPGLCFVFTEIAHATIGGKSVAMPAANFYEIQLHDFLKTTGKPYVAFWLTNQARGEYADLILTRKLLAELPALFQSTNQSILESDALIATTYARDSIWNVDWRPFKALTGVEMVGTNFMVIKGERFAYAEASLGEVQRLLRHPVGKIKIHTVHPGVAGQEEEVRTLAARIEQQLPGAGSNRPDGSAPVPTNQVISWDRAVQMIRSGEVVSVGQHHSLEVGLETKGGARYSTKEPRIDEVIRVVREQAPNARAIAIGTE